MIGLAALFNGAKLWINVEIAIVFRETGMNPYTWSRSQMKYGLQQMMNTAQHYDTSNHRENEPLSREVANIVELHTYIVVNGKKGCGGRDKRNIILSHQQ